MNRPAVIGLDPSLTSTGIAWNVPRHDGTNGDLWETHRIQPKRLTGHARLQHILDEVMNRCTGDDVDLVTIEGLAHHGYDAGQERAGLHWLIRQHLWLAQIPVAVVVPSQLKKYATGKGNAGKDQVLLAVAHRWAHVTVDGNDTADALVLASMAADHLGHPPVTLPATHREALDKVDWPIAMPDAIG